MTLKISPPTSDIPALANENNAEDETAADIQEQQRILEPNQEMDEVEQPQNVILPNMVTSSIYG